MNRYRIRWYDDITGHPCSAVYVAEDEKGARWQWANDHVRDPEINSVELVQDKFCATCGQQVP